jgi:hypothetical protein
MLLPLCIAGKNLASTKHFNVNIIVIPYNSALRKHERTGRPLGSKRFVGQLEEKLGRVLKPQKGGRPKKQKN